MVLSELHLKSFQAKRPEPLYQPESQTSKDQIHPLQPLCWSVSNDKPTLQAEHSVQFHGEPIPINERMNE